MPENKGQENKGPEPKGPEDAGEAIGCSPHVDPAPLRDALRGLQGDEDAVFGQFYSRLLEQRPDFARLFEDTNWTRQRRMLLQALVLAFELEEEPDVVRGALRGFAQRHEAFALSPKDYMEFGSILKETLREAIGDVWSSDVDHAWDSAYACLVEKMRNGGPATS